MTLRALIVRNNPFLEVPRLGPWHNEEMRLAIQRRVEAPQGRLRVLPVILPGGQRAKESDVPGFCRGTTWVEFGNRLKRKTPSTGLSAGSEGFHLAVDPEPPSRKDAALFFS